MHIYIYIYIYIYIPYVYIHVYIHIYVYPYTNIYVICSICEKKSATLVTTCDTLRFRTKL